jgi:hypothetical protein
VVRPLAFLKRALAYGPRLHRVVTGRILTNRLLPDFLIIGAQRCGTSALYSYLTQHPCVAPAAIKEIHYFDTNHHRGLRWYKTHFPSALHRAFAKAVLDRDLLTGESSPYYLFHPLAAARVRQTLPDVKLIVVLRNPIDRAFSHYHHAPSSAGETLPFEEAIAREPARLAGERERMLRDPAYQSAAHQHFSYLTRGVYADQLVAWFELFPRERFLVLQFEDVFRGPAAAYQRLVAFLGLPPWQPPAFPRVNATSYTQMDPALRQRLGGFFAPHNRRLYELLGVQWDWDK